MTVFELSNNYLSIKVNSFGAELCSVYSQEARIEYIWQANKDVWARYAPNLFPIVGKLKNGTYQYMEKSYSLPQHGFARDMEFICIHQSENELTFELVASEKTLENFPFHFSFQVHYVLIEKSVNVSYKVFNPDNKDLFFSVGAHPAFNCPLLPNETFESYQLFFNDINCLDISLLEDGLISDNKKTISLNNNTLQVKQDLFKNDALVFLNNQFNSVELKSTKHFHGVKLTAINWPYFGIWTKKDSSQFVCLEPWYGIADSVNSTGEIEEKNGIIKLKPYQNFKCDFKIDFF
jgi:galactose mutarotase-like enzyme